MISGRLARISAVAAATAVAVMTGAARASDCGTIESTGSTGEVSACYDKQLAAADQRLNAAYRVLMADADSDREKAALRDAQRAWLKFRDAHCAWRDAACDDGGQGGSMCAPVHVACEAIVTGQRADQLEDYHRTR